MIRVRQVKVPINDNNINKYVAKKLKINENNIINLKIVKQSVDSRYKPDIYFVYEVIVKLNINYNHFNNDVLEYIDESFKLPELGNLKMNYRPVIVGAGPSGLFAAYTLAYAGFKPIIIERGKDIPERIKDVEEFWNKRIINPESNVQYGLGGAGTFSDGKLNTLIKDNEHIGEFVFKKFVECGAPEEIMYSYKPHIGTNKLRNVISNLKSELESMGTTFIFNKCVTNINIDNNTIKSIDLSDGTNILCDCLILAIGNASRDLFRHLYSIGVNMSSKPFAIGVRIEHKQSDVNNNAYGEDYNDILGNFSYKGTSKTKSGRGVYTFCMCPGGYVVNSASDNNQVVTNGMSDYERDTNNANSALIVTVNNLDYGDGVLDGIKYQESIEKNIFNKTNGLVPVQLYKDFKDNKVSNSFGSIIPIHKGDYVLSNLNELLPKYICDSIKEAIEDISKRIPFFNDSDAILSAPETRSSCPVRIERNEELQTNIKGLYACGEGAGYAGGITTSAIDGVKVSCSIIKKYML